MTDEDGLLSAYHRLPFVGKVAVASLRGLYLRSVRYGRETQRYVEEAFERERWSLAQWNTWQEERIAEVLRHAAAHVPYYRRLWQERRKRGDRASYECLSNWPVLKKEAVRSRPEAFLADGCNARKLFALQSSGTTGTPLKMWRSKETLRRWYALNEARVCRWNGVSNRERWAMIGGRLVVAFDRSEPPFWVWNAGMRQLYMSCIHLSPKHAPDYVDALKKYRIEYILGYPSALYPLARAILEHGLVAPKLKVVISNAEPLYQHQREVMATAFDCPVRDTYGMCEIVAAGSECEKGRMHVWPDVGVIELLDDYASHPGKPGRPGRLVATGLVNKDMPLIRYEVGDRVSLQDHADPCACGRRLPVFESIEGRLDDAIVTHDGRIVGRLDHVFKDELPIREAQIIQESVDLFRVRVVPDINFEHSHSNTIAEALRSRVGDVEIRIEPVDAIARTGNGKFRGVISHIASRV